MSCCLPCFHGLIMSTQESPDTDRQHNMCREHNVTTLPNKHQQVTPCVGDTPICAVLLWLSCVYRSLPRNPPSTSFSCPDVCDWLTLTLAGNVMASLIQYHTSRILEYTKCCPYIFDCLCFFPEAHPRNLRDIRQHATNTNEVTAPPRSTSSSRRSCGRFAGYCCSC